MRTNIDIKEETLNQVIRLSRAKSQKRAIEEAILKYNRKMAQLKLLDLMGKIKWEGDLEEMRTSKYL